MGGENQEETRASESTRSVGSVLSVHFEIGVLSIFDGDQTRLLSNSAFERAASSNRPTLFCIFPGLSQVLRRNVRAHAGRFLIWRELHVSAAAHSHSDSLSPSVICRVQLYARCRSAPCVRPICKLARRRSRIGAT